MALPAELYAHFSDDKTVYIKLPASQSQLKIYGRGKKPQQGKVGFGTKTALSLAAYSAAEVCPAEVQRTFVGIR